MADAVIADNVGYRYGMRWVFRNLNLSLSSHQLTAILGPNGCGKSTLLSVLSGDREPREGRVNRLIRKLAFVPQSLNTTLPISGEEMVLLGRSDAIPLFSTPRKVDFEASREALATLGISHLAQRDFSVMSGGEKQLVLIARAMVSQCNVLLLDEPTSALDWHHQAEVLNLMRSLADNGLSVAFTTHSPQHALDFADRVLLMPEASEHIYGHPYDVLDEAILSKLYRINVRRVDIQDLVSTAIPVFRNLRTN